MTNAADREVIALTHHGKEKYVMMRVEEYEKLSRRSQDPRSVGRTSDMPAELQDLFFTDVPARSAGAPDLVQGEVPFDLDHPVDVLAHGAEDD